MCEDGMSGDGGEGEECGELLRVVDEIAEVLARREVAEDFWYVGVDAFGEDDGDGKGVFEGLVGLALGDAVDAGEENGDGAGDVVGGG